MKKLRWRGIESIGACNHSGKWVLESLKLVNVGLGTTVQQRIAVIKFVCNKRSANGLCHVIGRRWSDMSECPDTIVAWFGWRLDVRCERKSVVKNYTKSSDGVRSVNSCSSNTDRCDRLSKPCSLSGAKVDSFRFVWISNNSNLHCFFSLQKFEFDSL